MLGGRIKRGNQNHKRNTMMRWNHCNDASFRWNCWFAGPTHGTTSAASYDELFATTTSCIVQLFEMKISLPSVIKRQSCQQPFQTSHASCVQQHQSVNETPLFRITFFTKERIIRILWCANHCHITLLPKVGFSCDP